MPDRGGMRRLRNVFLSAAIAATLGTEPLGCAAHQSNASIMHRDTIMGLVRGDQHEDDAVEALDNMQRYGSRESAAIAGRIPQHHARARELIAELGMQRADAAARINVAYGIAAIGEERARELYSGLGIQYFMRYSRETLIEVHSNIVSSQSGRPLLVVAFNKNDWNGAFYREGHSLEQLTRAYRMVLFETDGEQDFYRRVREVSSAHGRISALIIAGHGESGSVQLGENNDAGRLDLDDREEISALRDNFAQRPLVILVSCSTGASDKAIGAVVSNALRARLYAPITPSSSTEYHLDRNGFITEVTYNVERRTFVSGVAQ
jgi:hypothetical protein